MTKCCFENINAKEWFVLQSNNYIECDEIKTVVEMQECIFKDCGTTREDKTLVRTSTLFIDISLSLKRFMTLWKRAMRTELGERDIVKLVSCYNLDDKDDRKNEEIITIRTHTNNGEQIGCKIRNVR